MDFVIIRTNDVVMQKIPGSPMRTLAHPRTCNLMVAVLHEMLSTSSASLLLKDSYIIFPHKIVQHWKRHCEDQGNNKEVSMFEKMWCNRMKWKYLITKDPNLPVLEMNVQVLLIWTGKWLAFKSAYSTRTCYKKSTSSLATVTKHVSRHFQLSVTDVSITYGI